MTQTSGINANSNSISLPSSEESSSIEMSAARYVLTNPSKTPGEKIQDLLKLSISDPSVVSIGKDRQIFIELAQKYRSFGISVNTLV